MKITEVKAIPLFVPLETSVGAPISLPYADQIASVVFGGTNFILHLFFAGVSSHAETRS